MSPTIHRLDHVNLRTTRLTEMRDFYRNVLGLREGARPRFPFDGAWLYCGGHAVVHLVCVDQPGNTSQDLTLEHFAFAASGFRPFVERLKSKSVDYRLGIVKDFALCQVDLRDPDGNHVHVDFPLGELEE